MTVSEALEILKDNDYVVLLEENTAVMLSNLGKSFTGLPMNIWIDVSGTYKKGKHSKRLKFQTNTSDKFNINELATMDFNGIVRTDLPKYCKIKNKELDKLRIFISNNKKLLELVADARISEQVFYKLMVKGVLPLSDTDYLKLLQKIKKYIKE